MIRNSEKTRQGGRAQICIDYTDRPLGVARQHFRRTYASATAAIPLVDTCKHDCPWAFSGLLQEDALNKPQTFFASQPIEIESRPISVSSFVSIDWHGCRLALGHNDNFPFVAGPLE
jgi:hypothetical protein